MPKKEMSFEFAPSKGITLEAAAQEWVASKTLEEMANLNLSIGQIICMVAKGSFTIGATWARAEKATITRDDLEIAWGAGHARCAWEETNYGNELSKEDWFQKYYPSPGEGGI